MSKSLVDAMTVWLNSKLEDVHTAIPGKIEKYDEATHTADVSPLLSKITVKNVEIVMPVIPGVPVMFPSGQSFGLTWEVQKGDGVLLIFSEVALGAWVNSEGDKQVAPEGKHRFSETDAIAILGLSPKVVEPLVSLHVDKDGKLNLSGAKEIMIEDSNGNTLEMSSSGTSINGTNLEIDL